MFIQFVIILSVGNVTISEAITGVASITVDRTTGMSYRVKSTPFFYKNHVFYKNHDHAGLVQFWEQTSAWPSG